MSNPDIIKHYRIKTVSHAFNLTVSPAAGIINLSIGGKRKGCVNISVNTPDSILVQRALAPVPKARGGHSIEVATMPQLKWYSDCSVDEPLPRGDGTIHMIKTLLSEMKKRYPYVKYITLMDNSHIRCSQGKEISLLALSFSIYSKTWYERIFNATLQDLIYQEKYILGNKILNDPETKLSFEEFTQLFGSYTRVDTLNKLKPYYESTVTYTEFFQTLYKGEGKESQCNLIVDWIDIFLQYIFGINLQSLPWIIKRESIEDIVILEEHTISQNPYTQSAGRRNTRKSKSKVNSKNRLDYSDAVYTD